jgi:dihydrodipicolinate synthase/N-acetylneuraminate lyase
LISAADVRGVIPALVTPFPKNDEVDLKGLPGGHLRGPLPELTDEEKAGVKAALKTIGAL